MAELSFNLFSIPIFFTSLLFLVLIFLSYDKENRSGEVYFCLLLFSCFVYSFLYGMELISTSEEAIVHFFQLEFFGGVFLTPLLLAFVVKYTGNSRYFKPKIWVLIFGIPVFFLIMSQTNAYHHLFFIELSTKQNAYFNAISFTPGILYWVYAIFNVVPVLFANYLLFRMLSRVPKIFSVQVTILLIGTLIPWSFHIVDLLGYSPYSMDLVPFSLGISSVIIYLGLFKYGLFKNAPVAFKTIFENLLDGVLILNNKGEIITQNQAAIQFFQKSTIYNLLTKKELLQNWPQLTPLFNLENFSEQVELHHPEENRVLSAYRENRRNQKGWDNDFHYIIIKDITVQKSAEATIRSKELALQTINTSLLRNEKMLKSIAMATKELLSNTKFNKAAQKAISILGDGAGVDRAYLFENTIHENGKITSSQRFEWSASAVAPEIDNPGLQYLPLELFGEAVDFISSNKIYQAIVSKISTDPELKELLESQEIKSILLIPIFVKEDFWGFVGFDDCVTERIWSEAEAALLISFADSISNAIERKTLELNLFKSMQQAKEASIAKSEFLANMSHEIRTPLNGVIGFSDLLMRTGLNETQKEYLKSIFQSGNLLLDLINDILDFSKIEAGKLALNPIKVNLKKMTQEALTVVQPLAEEKGLKLLLLQDLKTPKFSFLDDIRVKQILINLLSNAIKFTATGHVELAIKVKSIRLEEKLALVEFSVTDTGIGISKEKEKVIFEAFAQEDNSTTRKYGGTGLGLTISNKLLALMDSRLELETTFGKGSKFSFLLTLPYEEGEVSSEDFSNKTIESPPRPVTNNIKKGFKFLLVDDNPVNMLLAKTIVKNIVPSAILLEAKNGKLAVDLFAQNKPDMVFMDIQMPEMSGYEATENIRKLETSSRTPIIALTAGTVLGEYERCLEAGMDDYLSKPIVVSDISNMIQKYLGTTSPKEALHFLAKFDEFKTNDPAFFQELIQMSKTNLEKLNSELMHFWIEKNLNLVKQTGHSLKGLALNMDFEHLVKLASNVEKLQDLAGDETESLMFQIGSEIKQIIKSLELELINI
ncbi:hypothetical protein P872_20970 [Rhodonellum psychrophilum GCM71 = DSM 17998]|uniref:histidine kinase n=2 Tax=Rhodonellum TaxID=336827 RepID=U5BS93_9BACT|nr:MULTISPECIES: histidine kinase N-terminal 7TM domain-containing protein [Rhodonellum]ERM80778.1 hypothetical protein P872_20970 [Rhodonellum psychrophilum GCM71 = DSM 17998]SDZ44732.1 Signal transduction histidine kinase [Rhodonellum ikkaensis]